MRPLYQRTGRLRICYRRCNDTRNEPRPECISSTSRALPAMRGWYEAALKEVAREPGHEAEALGAGIVLQDLRATPVS